MFKSIFSKYLIAFTALLICGFLMLLLIFGSVLRNYSEETKQTEMAETAAKLANTLCFLYEESDCGDFALYLSENRSNIRSMLDVLLDDRAESYITVSDTDVKTVVIGHVGPIDGEIQRKCRERAEYALSYLSSKGASAPQALPVRPGIDDEQEYACCTAVTDAHGNALGVVAFAAASAGWTDITTSPLKSASVAAVWVIVAAVIALYFITERVIDPLREMSRAAKRMAKGKFDTRIRVRGRDEVAELAIAFNQMAVSLQNLDWMRNSFIANISHDLRTPMTTIAGFIDGILDGVIPPDEQAHYLGVVSQEVRRLSRLVNELLDLSRLQAGDRKLTMTSFDICEMGRQILISFEQKIDDKQLDVSFDCDEERMFVSADSDAVHQILYNLVDNAVKFSREGGKLAMRFRWEDPDFRSARKAVVSVFNEGDGIPPEDIPFIFERFYKSDKSRSKDKTGVGLGMFIAKTIIDAHNESISVHSEYGKNCEFIFTLSEGEPPARSSGSGERPGTGDAS